uniref:Uncharacterized protein n=1 Tax=Ditylenchus dipsaci TaxID=166011 RepID=A0A915E278_9BILA
MVLTEDSILLDAGASHPEEYKQAPPNILLMYLLHALPYTQSAFNWLFYAFLNRNLRQSNRCPGMSTRSIQVTSTPAEGNGHTTTTSNGNGTNGAPIWRNLQYMGSYLKSASIDTGQSVIKRSPFRSRSRIRSRSTTCLETSSSYNHNGDPTIISLIDPSPTAANGLLAAPNSENHFFTSFSLNTISKPVLNGREKRIGSIRRLVSQSLSRPSWPNGLTSQNHYNAPPTESPTSTPSSFTSLGLGFEPIAEDDCQDVEDLLDPPLITTLSMSSKDIVVNGTGQLTLLDLESIKQLAPQIISLKPKILKSSGVRNKATCPITKESELRKEMEN